MVSQTTPAFSSARPLTAKYKQLIAKGIKKEAKAFKVVLPEGVDLSAYEFLGRKTTRLANRPLSESGETSKNYETNLRQFWRFAAMKGDYGSMMLMLKKPPTHCPAMDVYTVEQYLRFKRLDPGSPLLDLDDEPILDVFGEPMTADGGWKAPKCVDNFRGVLHDIHVANSHSVEYEEKCLDCDSAPERHLGCEHHLGNPRLFRKGDPSRNIIWTNTLTQMDKLAAKAGYKEKGSSQLLPSDLRLLRSRLLSTCSMVDLQMWVVIIVATKLGLRYDEYHELHSDHFLPDFFEIPDSMIESMRLQ